MANNVTLTAGQISAEDLVTVASTVDTIIVPDDWDTVQLQGSGAIGTNLYYTLDGSTPTVGGHNTYEMLGQGAGLLVSGQEHNFAQGAGTTVKLISGGVFTYSVSRRS